MLTQVRHRWETVALPGGGKLCATHGCLMCVDGEHRYDVTSYRDGTNVYTTLMVYNTDGTCPSSFAHEFVSDTPWGNTQTEEALIRFCNSRDGGVRRDGTVREDWGGFKYFVQEKTDVQGNDIYGSPVVTAFRWIPFDEESCTVKAAKAGVMDDIDLSDVDTAEVEDHLDSADDDGIADDNRWEEGWDDDDHVPVEKEQDIYDSSKVYPKGKYQSLEWSEREHTRKKPLPPLPSQDGWEIWLACHNLDPGHGNPDENGYILFPPLVVYTHRRITDWNEALSLWDDCKKSYPGTPRALVRIADNTLTQIEDLSGFTVNVGTGVNYAGSLGIPHPKNECDNDSRTERRGSDNDSRTERRGSERLKPEKVENLPVNLME